MSVCVCLCILQLICNTKSQPIVTFCQNFFQKVFFQSLAVIASFSSLFASTKLYLKSSPLLLYLNIIYILSIVLINSNIYFLFLMDLNFVYVNNYYIC